MRTTSGDPLDAILRGEERTWDALGTTPAELLDECAAREISALIHHQVTRRGRPSDWPENVRRELARAAHWSAATELVRSRETAAVLEALESAGVHPILLKGVPLAHVVYDSPSLRTHADTDLIIRRDDVDRTRDAMRRMDYVESTMSHGELIFCQFQMIKHDRFGVDHAFDIHWKISTQPVFAEVLTYDDLSAASVPVPTLGTGARAAGPVHALLLACIHPAMHHRNAERLIWLYDIHLLASLLSPADLDRFAVLAVNGKVAAICRHQLELTRARFGTLLPAGVMASLARQDGREPSEIYLRAERRWHHELASSVQGLPRLPRPRAAFAGSGSARAGVDVESVRRVAPCVDGPARVVHPSMRARRVENPDRTKIRRAMTVRRVGPPKA